MYISYESEGRTPSLDFLQQLVKELKINPQWFLSGSGEMLQNNDSLPITSKVELYRDILQILEQEGYIKQKSRIN